MQLSDWRAIVRDHLPPLDVSREPEIVDELAQHLAELYAEAIAAGASHEAAFAAARRALPPRGDHLAADILTAGRTLPGIISDRWSAAIDDATPRRGPRPWSGLRQDLLVSLRTLAHSRGFVAIALLTLAIGIGATSAIFAAVDTILLRPMPYPHADRLVVPVSVHQGRGIFDGSVSFADYMDWRRETTIFDAVALWQQVITDMTEYGEPERVEGARVSEEYFRLIDVSPSAGRTFVPADHAAKAARVMLISHGLWQRRFGGAADTVGKTIRLGGTPVAIIGIMPPHRAYPDDASFWIPMRPELMEADTRERRDNMVFQSIARLKDGVTRDQGNAVLATIAARVAREHASSRAGWTNRLEPLRNYLVSREMRLALVVLLAAVGGVLLIGCANLANLVLLRGMSRAREIGLRFALGASRWRIIRLQLAESLVLSFIGAALGAGLAAWMIQGLAAIAPEGTPFIHALGLNWRVLIGTIAFAVLAMLVTGVVPALANSSIKPAPALKDGSPGAGSSRRTVLLRQAFIVVEIAGAVTLLIGAALLIRSFGRVLHIDPGVDVDRVLTARISVPPARYDSADKTIAFFQRLTADLAAQPGVEAAAATSFVPVGGGGFGLGRVFLAEGWPEPPAVRDVAAQWNVITPDYFRAMGIRLVRGRWFDARDTRTSTPVIVVTETFAARMFGNEDPLGKRTRSWRDENVLREIVGVVADIRYDGLTSRDFSLVYVPHTQNSWGLMNVVVRAPHRSPDQLTPVLRRTIAAIDPLLALSNVQTLAGAARESIARERYTTLLLSLLAATALLLGAIGVYGVISQAVSAMRNELGVRIALGASRRHLYVLVLRQGIRLLVVGLAIGLAIAYGASRALAALLYETTTTDVLAYGVTITLVVGTTLLATFVPARRAANSDPVIAIRGTG